MYIYKLCFAVALLVIFKAWRLPAERGIETVYRFILCVSLLYRIGWVIAHKAKRARFGRFRRGPVGTAATSRREAISPISPKGGVRSPAVQPAGPLSMID